MYRKKIVLGLMFAFITNANAELFRMQADAPINGFKMPMFDEQGAKIWQCFGERVHYIDENRIQMEHMKIEWLTPHKTDSIDMVVRSADATVSIPDHRAVGQSLITITNTGYTILGEDWTWEGKQKNKNFSKIFIRKNAHVMFFDEEIKKQ